MSRSKLSRALANNSGGVTQYVDPTNHEDFDDSQLMQEMFDNRSREDGDGGTAQALSNRRNTLMKKMGWDYLDVRELIPNPNNSYSIDDGSIEALAGMIYESKNTTPLIVRDTPEGHQIIDGERRYRAHLLLIEKYGERPWCMVPVRRYDIGALSDEDAEFILHAENIGQRNMSPSERAKGFAAVADRLIRQRQTDPSMSGRKTKEILAEQLGVSERTAAMEMNIGHNLGEEGMSLYDEGSMTKKAADAMARLDESEQNEIVAQVRAGRIKKDDVENVARGRVRSSVRAPKSSDECLKEARRSLKRAFDCDELPDRLLIAELRNLLDKLDPDKAE